MIFRIEKLVDSIAIGIIDSEYQTRLNTLGLPNVFAYSSKGYRRIGNEVSYSPGSGFGESEFVMLNVDFENGKIQFITKKMTQ